MTCRACCVLNPQRKWSTRAKPCCGDSLRLEIDLWVTAYRFKQGRRLRLIISSGAHPRWARNTGTGEPIGTTTTLLAADQTILHDREHPSALILPVVIDH